MLRRGALQISESRPAGVKSRLPAVHIELETEGVRIGQPFEFVGIERAYRGRLVEPYVFVELIWHDRLKVVTLKLRVGPVDHSDCAFQKWFVESFLCARGAESFEW